MKPNPNWLPARLIGKIQENKFFYVALSCIYTDINKRTVWIDLESKSFSFKQFGIFKYVLKRVNGGTSKDFSFLPIAFTGNGMSSLKILRLFDDITFWAEIKKRTEIKENLELSSIRSKMNLIFNIISQIAQQKKEGNEPQLEEFIKDGLNLTQDDLLLIQNFTKFVDLLPKKNMQDLLSNSRYSLLNGQLTLKEDMSNKVISEVDSCNVPEGFDINKLKSYFADVKLSDEIFEKVLIGMGIDRILRGEKPKTGGIILIDHGGTGKSLLKKSLIELFESFHYRGKSSVVKEKEKGDITSYVNSGPQIIKKWYRGGPTEEVTGEAEEDLVAVAKNSGLPSLLVIDEAEEFIREKTHGERDPLNALETLKRYIQDSSKGGVTGYVLTLLIANIDEKNIHAPLGQGSERLTIIEVGTPRDIDSWLNVINNVFFEQNNLKFKDNLDLKKLAKLLLLHKHNVSHEIYEISPRNLNSFSSDYYLKYSENLVTGNNKLNAFQKMMPRKEEVSNLWEIDFNDFLKHIISDLLLSEAIKDDTININTLKHTYENFLEGETNFSNEGQTDVELHNLIQKFQEKSDVNLLLLHTKTHIHDSLESKYNFSKNLKNFYLEIQGKIVESNIETNLKIDEYNKLMLFVDLLPNLFNSKVDSNLNLPDETVFKSFLIKLYTAFLNDTEVNLKKTFNNTLNISKQEEPSYVLTVDESLFFERFKKILFVFTSYTPKRVNCLDINNLDKSKIDELIKSLVFFRNNFVRLNDLFIKSGVDLKRYNVDEQILSCENSLKILNSWLEHNSSTDIISTDNQFKHLNQSIIFLGSSNLDIFSKIK
jgi:hypothetical protein